MAAAKNCGPKRVWIAEAASSQGYENAQHLTPPRFPVKVAKATIIAKAFLQALRRKLESAPADQA